MGESAYFMYWNFTKKKSMIYVDKSNHLYEFLKIFLDVALLLQKLIYIYKFILIC